MEVLTNFDLLTVGITVASTLVLGTSVYFTDSKSLTNRMFFGFSVVTAVWGVVNFLSYQFSDSLLTLWLFRGIMFCAVFQSLFLYEFFSVFPERERLFSRWHNFLLIPIVGATAILTFTPYVFSGTVGTVTVGKVALVEHGLGLPLFIIVAVGLILSALGIFFIKFYRAIGQVRRAISIVLVGTAVTFALIISFNLVFATILADPRYVPYGSLFMFPFIAFASYAILRERLFRIKVIATSLLVFILAIISFGEIIFSNTLPLTLFRTGVFVLVLVFGINIIRSVIREIEQRERLQKLTEELQMINERQELLIHFIGHEVKGFLTKDEGAFAALLEGDFGVVPDTAKPIIERALTESRHGADSVASILKASNLKKGTVTFTKEPFDLRALVTEIVERARSVAEQKGLTLSLSVEDADYTYMGDKGEIGDHVFRNLIDNAVNYTPSGSVSVSLKKEEKKILFAVEDTGVGITSDDKEKLFTEGGHGKDSVKVNAHSTGYGLFIAKNITEAHGGSVRALSDGAGQGSTFIVELPA